MSLPPRAGVLPALLALCLHLAVLLGAISATAMSRATSQSAARDTIHLDLARLPVLEPQRSPHAAPPTGIPEIPEPPLVPELPLGIATPELPRFAGPLLNVAALSVTQWAADSTRSAASLESARAVLPMIEVDVLPELTSHFQPRYPEPLRRAGVSGQVVLEYVVQSSGSIDTLSVRVVLSTHPAFSESAREALRNAHFRPARRAGRPVAVQVRQAIRFVTR